MGVPSSASARPDASAVMPPHVPRSESTTRTAWSDDGFSGRRFGFGAIVGSP